MVSGGVALGVAKLVFDVLTATARFGPDGGDPTEGLPFGLLLLCGVVALMAAAVVGGIVDALLRSRPR